MRRVGSYHRAPRNFFSPLLGLPCLVLSSRPERPDFFFRAAVWRVGPRSGGISPPLSRQLPLLASPNNVLRGHPSLAHLECGGSPPLLQPQPAPANRSSSPAHHRAPRNFFSPLLGLPCLVLSSRPERPDLLFRAAVWRVGPRSGGISPPLSRQLPLLASPNNVLEGAHPSRSVRSLPHPDAFSG